MAYSQAKELTDTEKRLQALKIQLFGKEKNIKVQNNKMTATNQSATLTLDHHQHQDLAYLRKDLLKIATLAIIALFVQLMLKFVVKI
ncbi:MAG: hypothetical protein WCV81_01010 [Microgenomates group bacterium]|jgi:hypothetical protein